MQEEVRRARGASGRFVGMPVPVLAVLPPEVDDDDDDWVGSLDLVRPGTVTLIRGEASAAVRDHLREVASSSGRGVIDWDPLHGELVAPTLGGGPVVFVTLPGGMTLPDTFRVNPALVSDLRLACQRHGGTLVLCVLPFDPVRDADLCRPQFHLQADWRVEAYRPTTASITVRNGRGDCYDLTDGVWRPDRRPLRPPPPPPGPFFPDDLTDVFGP